MKISAYILAADPAWIEPSIKSYYDCIDELVVSYDSFYKGWTGMPIRAQECIDRIQALDRDKKVRLLTGDYARLTHQPMENDSHQRQCALSEAGKSAEWVLQLDTDEILPNARRFIEILTNEVPSDATGVAWPMRAVFKQSSPNWFLTVSSRMLRRQISEYPGCAAVRGSAVLELCRYPKGRSWRCDIRSNSNVINGRIPPLVDKVISKTDAIIHFSWARTESDLRNKVANWSHSDEFDGIKYLETVWKPANWKWPLMSNFHPLIPRVWPALRPTYFGNNITHGYRTDV